MTTQPQFPVTARRDITRPTARTYALELAGGDARRLVTLPSGAVVVVNRPGQPLPAPAAAAVRGRRRRT